jgi:phosphoglucosamine mutase
MQAVRRQGYPLATLLAGVDLFPQTLINVRLAPGTDWRASGRLAETQEAVVRELGDGGRVLIRPSGTEPVVRVMVEARDKAQAANCAERLADALRAA